jgi:hypothetical protein
MGSDLKAVVIRSYMATEHILALLIQERDKLNKAIDALGVGAPAKAPGRPPKDSLANALDWVTGGAATAKTAPVKKGRREFTPEQRAEQAKRMKMYWAKKRKAKA